MKKTLPVLLLLLVTCVGCFTWPHDFRSGGAQAPLPAPLPPGPVTADQVETGNAHRVADAIWDEMDREQQNDILSGKTKDTKKK
jgi:hypothetical protein